MTCDSYCKGCYYLGHANSYEPYCLYWEKADQLRGCPAGAGCDKRITEKEYRKMAKIDKEAARSMWAAGKTDAEIAEVFGVTKQAVGCMRRRLWDENDAVEAGPVAEAPDLMEELAGAAPAAIPEAEDLDEDDSKTMIRALELMTSRHKGMDAVMTAQIVTTLWAWEDTEDLKEVRNCLDYLIGRREK